MNTVGAASQKVYFYILIRSWNAFVYFDRCVESVLAQDYPYYKILFVDDASDYTSAQVAYIRKKLVKHIVVFNTARQYAGRNAYELIHQYAENDEGVVVNVDGDDWLFGKDVLSTLAKEYKNPFVWMTYGECYFLTRTGMSSRPSRYVQLHTNTPYSRKTIAGHLYRQEPFYPLHIRTWKVWLYKKIKKQDLLFSDGTWLRFAEDLAMWFPMLEMAHGKFRVLTEPLYVYNTANFFSDTDEHILEVLRDELYIRKKTPYASLI